MPGDDVVDDGEPDAATGILRSAVAGQTEEFPPDGLPSGRRHARSLVVDRNQHPGPMTPRRRHGWSALRSVFHCVVQEVHEHLSPRRTVEGRDQIVGEIHDDRGATTNGQGNERVHGLADEHTDVAVFHEEVEPRSLASRQKQGVVDQMGEATGLLIDDLQRPEAFLIGANPVQ